MATTGIRTALVLALLTAACPAGAGLYKWIDADGKVHYSDQPPPDGAKQQEIKTPKSAAPASVPANATPGAAAPSQAAAKGPKTPAEQEMEFRKRRVEATEAEAKRQQEAQANAEKQRNCEAARNRVKQIEAGGRVAKAGANGETVYLGDEEIAREMADARKAADSWCK